MVLKLLFLRIVVVVEIVMEIIVDDHCGLIHSVVLVEEVKFILLPVYLEGFDTKNTLLIDQFCPLVRLLWFHRRKLLCPSVLTI